MNRLFALVQTWLTLDFFGDSRRTGEPGSTLTTAIFGQAFFGLIVAALLLPDQKDAPYAVAYAAANLSLSTLLLGIGMLADPRRLQRARADRVLVRTAPLGALELALARLVHGGFSIALVAIGVALPPAILMYWVAGHQLWVVPAYLAAACWLAGLMAGAISVAIRASAVLWGEARSQLIGGSLRAALLAGGFVGFATCLRHLDESATSLPFGEAGAMLWPPYWAARLLGSDSDRWLFAGLLVATSVAVFAASVVLQRASEERRAAPHSGRGPLARLDRRLAGSGPLLGATAYTSAMLYRSPSFRAKVLPIFGLPAAMIGLLVANAGRGESDILLGISLQFPAIYLPILVSFLGPADQESSAWVFATSPDAGPGLARRAALISLTTHVLLPVHSMAAAVMLALGRAPQATLALAFVSLAVAIPVARLSLRALPGMPFTDESDETSIDTGNLMAIALGLAAAGAGFGAAASLPGAIFVGAGALILSIWTQLPNPHQS